MSAVRHVVFRDYDAAGLDRFEVAVGEGVITMGRELPEEMNHWQARAVGELLLAAADELAGGVK